MFRIFRASILSLGLTAFMSSSTFANEAERGGRWPALGSDSAQWQTTNWGEEVNGVRMRVTLPREVGYGHSIPVIVELKVDQGKLPRRRLSAVAVSPNARFSLCLRRTETGAKQVCGTIDFYPATRGVQPRGPFPLTLTPWERPDPVLDAYVDGGTGQGHAVLVLPQLRYGGWHAIVRSPEFKLDVLPGAFAMDTVEFPYPTRVVLGKQWNDTYVVLDTATIDLEMRRGFKLITEISGTDSSRQFVARGLGSTDLGGFELLIRNFRKRNSNTMSFYLKLAESSQGINRYSDIAGYGYHVLWQGEIKIVIEEVPPKESDK